MIKEYKFDDDIIEPFRKLANQQAFTPSDVSISKDRVFDIHVRKSKSVTLFNQGELIQTILNQINEPNLSFECPNNEIKFILYEEGDFFVPHTDSCIKENGEEFTLTVCLFSNGYGGQTVIWYDYKSGYFTQYSTVTNCGILFSKDYKHSSSKIKQGKKLVAVIDLITSDDLTISNLYLNEGKNRPGVNIAFSETSVSCVFGDMIGN